MTIAARGGQPNGSVVRIGSLVVVRLVTGYTGGGNIAVIAVCMTLAAVDPRMALGQRKLRMIK